MKSILVFIACFVVATAAATGASVTLHKGHPHPADTLASAADTAAKDSLPGDSVTRAATDTANHVADSAAVGKTPSAAAPAPRATPPAQSKPPVSGSPDTATASERRVAKLFSSMEPAEAAKALEHMSDSDVQVILGYVGTRQAAAILAAMPSDRVATIGKLALHGRGQ
jgi:hypothetical protein